jgi:hypothetical protein
MIPVRLRFAVAMLAVALASPASWTTPAGAQAGAPMNGVTPAEAKAGWRSLFDGKTLNGWTSIGELKWTVVDGAMVGDAASQPAAKPLPPPANNPNGKPITWATGFLRSVETFDDFELSVEFWSEEDSNSGLFIRVGTPTNPNSLGGGYEINISDPHATSPTGSIVGVHSTLPYHVKSAGKWSRFDVLADGTHIVVKVNGETLTDVRDEKLKSGALGFQAGGPTGSGVIKFRNIKIRTLKQ